MKDFFIYFFGKGETPEFTNFTLAHFLPILVMLAVIALIYCYRKPLAQSKREYIWRYVLAFALIISVTDTSQPSPWHTTRIARSVKPAIGASIKPCCNSMLPKRIPRAPFLFSFNKAFRKRKALCFYK